MTSPIIMKFGGTSVGDAEQIERVAAIVTKHHSSPVVVVVSAMAGVTDMLISLTKALNNEAVGYKHLLADITERHMRTTNSLQLDPAERIALRQTMIERLHELEQTAETLGKQPHDLTKADYDRIVSFGERLSVELVSAALRHVGVKSEAISATRLIRTDDRFGDAEPQLDKSVPRVRNVITPLLREKIIPVVTGFIGETDNGRITTLGRGASDYTSTILGYCLDAEEVWIWTDVTGVLTADPRLIPEAKTITHLSYEEAAELSHFGAKVLHPLTIVPVSMKNIPIRIKNTFDHTNGGTVVSAHNQPSSGIKAVTAKHSLSLVTVRCKGVPRMSHIAARTFVSLDDAKIDVFLISHASSERTISFIVASTDGKRAATAVQAALSDDTAAGHIDHVHVRDNISIVAIVGDGLQTSIGVSGQLFSTLGARGVNVIAIAQGQFESNMSCVVDTDQADKAVKSLHQTFNLVGEKSPWQPLKRLLKR